VSPYQTAEGSLLDVSSPHILSQHCFLRSTRSGMLNYRQSTCTLGPLHVFKSWRCLWGASLSFALHTIIYPRKRGGTLQVYSQAESAVDLEGTTDPSQHSAAPWRTLVYRSLLPPSLDSRRSDETTKRTDGAIHKDPWASAGFSTRTAVSGRQVPESSQVHQPSRRSALAPRFHFTG
jgi:hypothetical protein